MEGPPLRPIQESEEKLRRVVSIRFKEDDISAGDPYKLLNRFFRTLKVMQNLPSEEAIKGVVFKGKLGHRGLNQKSCFLRASGEHGKRPVHANAEADLFSTIGKGISISASDIQKRVKVFPTDEPIEKRKALPNKKRGDRMVPFATMGVTLPIRFLIRITNV